MTDSNRGFSEVPALIAERRRYESWLAALDARRETTPVHVFERVQADYRARLQRVAEQIASHRQAIEEERANVDSRLALLEAEERMRRDERAELELRSHVGELIGDEATSAFGAVDDAIAQLVNEKGGLQARISELDALLETPETQPLVSSEGGGVTAATGASVSEELHASPGRVSSSEASEPAAVPAPEPATAPRASSDAPAEARVSPSSPSPAVASRPSESLRTPSGTFDELKFLNTVIGKESPAGTVKETTGVRPRVQVTGETTAGGVGVSREPAAAAAAQPAAATAPSGATPARASVAVDQAKTLKCSECGAANYPTEWYCERCGAELAAL